MDKLVECHVGLPNCRFQCSALHITIVHRESHAQRWLPRVFQDDRLPLDRAIIETGPLQGPQDLPRPESRKRSLHAAFITTLSFSLMGFWRRGLSLGTGRPSSRRLSRYKAMASFAI